MEENSLKYLNQTNNEEFQSDPDNNVDQEIPN